MLVPIAARSWLDDQTGLRSHMMGASGLPANYETDVPGSWAPIADEWTRVTPDRWEITAGNHKARVRSDSSFTLDWRRGFANRHVIGMQTRRLVKVRISDKAISTLATATPKSVSHLGGGLRFADIFPGIDETIIYERDRFSTEFTFHQSARDQIAGEGPWAGHALGIVSEIDLTNINGGALRDRFGDIPLNTAGRFVDKWVDFHIAGDRIFGLPTTYLVGPDGATTSIPVYKLIIKIAAGLFFVELFDPVAANALPQGNISHDATFGSSGTSGSNLGIVHGIYGSPASPTSDGTIDKMTAYVRNAKFFSTAHMKCALYDDGSPPLGSSARESSEVSLFDDLVFAWKDFTMSGESISSSNTYVLAIWSDGAGGTGPVYLKVDTSTGTMKYDSSETYGGSWTDLTGSATSQTRIYGTYTESAGPPPGSLALLGVGV